MKVSGWNTSQETARKYDSYTWRAPRRSRRSSDGFSANRPDSDMPEDLRDEGVGEGVDTIARHTFSKERQPQVTLELSYHQPN